MQPANSETCQHDLSVTMTLLEKAVKLSGFTTSTFCRRILNNDYSIVERMENGRITVVKLAEVKATLEKYIKDYGEPDGEPAS